MRLDMDTYARLTADQRDAVRTWVQHYVDADMCFAVDLVSDGPRQAAQFSIYDRDLYRPEMDQVPSHLEQHLFVTACPWPFAEVGGVA